jgi:hypothetical protein
VHRDTAHRLSARIVRDLDRIAKGLRISNVTRTARGIILHGDVVDVDLPLTAVQDGFDVALILIVTENQKLRDDQRGVHAAVK